MARPAPDAVIFDLDGVLVDSYVAVTESVNGALADHGLAPRPPEELRHLIGPPTFIGFSELTGEPVDSPALAAIVASYRARYGAVFLTKTTVIEGILPVLRELAQRLPLAVATSKSVTFTQPLLVALGLDGFFVTVAAAADTEDDKKAIVARALATLDCRSAAMVGDRSFDMDAARAHGLLAIGATWGIGSVEELRGAGADLLVEDPQELLGVLTGSEPIDE